MYSWRVCHGCGHVANVAGAERRQNRAAGNMPFCRQRVITIIVLFDPQYIYNPKRVKKWRKKYEIGYDCQSVQSVASKLSWSATPKSQSFGIGSRPSRALPSSTYPPSKFTKVVSWCPRSVPQLVQRCNEHRGRHISPLCEWMPSLLLHLRQEQLS